MDIALMRKLATIPLTAARSLARTTLGATRCQCWPVCGSAPSSRSRKSRHGLPPPVLCQEGTHSLVMAGSAPHEEREHVALSSDGETETYVPGRGPCDPRAQTASTLPAV